MASQIRYKDVNGQRIAVDWKSMEQTKADKEQAFQEQLEATAFTESLAPEDLKKRIEELEAKLALFDKTIIKIVGDYDGTNVPVTVNGIRRKIATSSP